MKASSGLSPPKYEASRLLFETDVDKGDDEEDEEEDEDEDEDEDDEEDEFDGGKTKPGALFIDCK